MNWMEWFDETIDCGDGIFEVHNEGLDGPAYFKKETLEKEIVHNDESYEACREYDALFEEELTDKGRKEADSDILAEQEGKGWGMAKIFTDKFQEIAYCEDENLHRGIYLPLDEKRCAKIGEKHIPYADLPDPSSINEGEVKHYAGFMGSSAILIKD